MLRFKLLQTDEFTEPNEVHKDIMYTASVIEKDPENELHINHQLSLLYDKFSKLKAPCFSFYNICDVFTLLSVIEISYQDMTQSFIKWAMFMGKQLLDSFTPSKERKLSSMKKQANYFAKIFRALPKLPIEWDEHKVFLLKLAHNLEIFYQSGNYETYMYDPTLLPFNSQIVGAIIKLPLEFSKKKLIAILLAPLDQLNNDFSSFDEFVLAPLWQFLVFHQWHISQNEEKKKLFRALEFQLEKKVAESPITSSQFQENNTRKIKSILCAEAQDKMKIEYTLGPYKVDAVFIKEKLIIELNGPHHYRGEILRRLDRFRAFILTRRANWHTVNIPYFEIEAAETQGNSVSYLVQKLQDYPALLNKRVRKFLEHTKEAVAIEKSGIVTLNFFQSLEPQDATEQKETAVEKYIPPHRRSGFTRK